ncbi:MAG: hypothetical protein AAGF99_00265 [Bacteroidota bacterium]
MPDPHYLDYPFRGEERPAEFVVVEAVCDVLDRLAEHTRKNQP